MKPRPSPLAIILNSPPAPRSLSEIAADPAVVQFLAQIHATPETTQNILIAFRDDDLATLARVYIQAGIRARGERRRREGLRLALEPWSWNIADELAGWSGESA